MKIKSFYGKIICNDDIFITNDSEEYDNYLKKLSNDKIFFVCKDEDNICTARSLNDKIPNNDINSFNWDIFIQNIDKSFVNFFKHFKIITSSNSKKFHCVLRVPYDIYNNIKPTYDKIKDFYINKNNDLIEFHKRFIEECEIYINRIQNRCRILKDITYDNNQTECKNLYNVSLDLIFKDTKYAKLFYELLKHNNVRIVLESRKNK